MYIERDETVFQCTPNVIFYIYQVNLKLEISYKCVYGSEDQIIISIIFAGIFKMFNVYNVNIDEKLVSFI
jgi:hypothetical protein